MKQNIADTIDENNQSFAQSECSGNMPAKIIFERLRHASIVLMLDTYNHVLPIMQKGATSKIEK